MWIGEDTNHGQKIDRISADKIFRFESGKVYSLADELHAIKNQPATIKPILTKHKIDFNVFKKGEKEGRLKPDITRKLQ